MRSCSSSCEPPHGFGRSRALTSESYQIIRDELPELLPRLWRFALTLSGRQDAAEDLVQATCVRALERAEQFTPGTRLDRWTFTILASIHRNQARATRIRLGNGHVDAAESLTITAAETVEHSVLLRQVLYAAGSLPAEQRSAIVLVYVEGWSYKDAAAVENIPVGTLMSRLGAAKRALMGQLLDPSQMSCKARRWTGKQIPPLS